MPKGAEDDIIKGMYLLREADKKAKLKVQLLGCGTILREVLAAAELLEKDFGVSADIWSVTSFNELAREARDIERDNRLHPKTQDKTSFVTQKLMPGAKVVVSATDYMMSYSDQIRAFIPEKHFVTLGTDGFGRSDTRKQLRHFFEVDAKAIVLATVKALADTGDLTTDDVEKVIKDYGINPNKPNPVTV